MKAAILALILLISLAGESISQSMFAISPANAMVHMRSSSVVVTEETKNEFSISGQGLKDGEVLTLTHSKENCDSSKYPHLIEGVTLNGTEGKVKLILPDYSSHPLFFCLNGVHQGAEPWLAIYVKETEKPILPSGLAIFCILILLSLSGVFSGLNVGLMSFAPQELQIMIDAGDEKQKKYAKRILPLRKRGNFLLCTILFSNVLVNNTTTILMEGLAGGVVAVLGATVAIVLFGEIFPQAVCARHALLIGAHTTWIMKFFVMLTSPLSYPLSIVLDFFLGEEVGAYYERNQLLQMVKMQQEHTHLANSEVDIITGALTYASKVARQIMTPLENVDMIDVTTVLDFKAMKKIIEMGHTRIPCYRGDRDDIVGVLCIKDLAFIDPDDETPLETVLKYYNHRMEWVYDDTKLDILLELFKQGRSEMFLVVDIDDTGDGDPVRRTVGIVTLEDVIEEIIQADIQQEDDGAHSHHSHHKGRPAPRDFGFAAKHHVKLSDQMVRAASAYLSSAIAQFAPDKISPTLLRKLVARVDCHRELFLEDLKEEDLALYVAGQPSSIFTLVLEGHITVEMGVEKLQFEAGPFHHFGVGALDSAEFVADFTATIKSPSVLLLQIPRALYQEAVSGSRWKSTSSSGHMASASSTAAAAATSSASIPRLTSAEQNESMA